MKAPDARDRVVRRVHEVRAVTAVDVYVDESRHDHAIERVAAGGRIGGVANVSDAAVVDADQRSFAKLAADEGAAENGAVAHKQILPRIVECPPVTEATFVSRPEMESLAISAMAIASFSCRNS